MHQKLRKAPPLKGPEVLQEKWDKKKTVFQKYVFPVSVKAAWITLLIRLHPHSYAALGLLPSIPVSKGASTSRSQRVKLPEVPAEAEAQNVKVGFGRIIRDEEGNVIDIIIDEDEEKQEEEQIEVDEEKELEPVEAKTEVVKRRSFQIDLIPSQRDFGWWT